MSAQLDQAAAPPPFPQYLAHLVDRAGTLLQANWGSMTAVDFTWWADGKEYEYMARLEWPLEEPAPRTVVFDRRSGEFRCRSLKGNLCEIDPTRWFFDSPLDELDRFIWDEEQQRKRQARR